MDLSPRLAPLAVRVMTFQYCTSDVPNHAKLRPHRFNYGLMFLGWGLAFFMPG